MLGTACSSPVAAAQQITEPPQDVFAAAVRTTEALSPAEELKQLQVPNGFKITLFASEPQIQKPLNMAFDADGRLWVSGSNEYPYPAAEGEGRDSIRILEDTNGDGAADSMTVFADDLNIPMGLYPYKDGVIAFSIPNIVFLRDTNNDGRADKREVLYGPFDTSRDTHGMNNAFRRGFDGWLYCCHGFNNQSSVRGTDGHEVSMHSGNTYRIRLDGSRIEHFTHGQVNPFGMAIDANGDIFNSDCHTKPVSLLLRGGYYQSFGKPHDGLGYVPPVMEHLHGSTAIDALCQYQAKNFPKEFHDNIFVGNVMTSRIHRNAIQRAGSSVRMTELPDLLTSKDPWFRPVDIQVGPDGALYVADFYNRVIGHYEVPLNHPGRDRERGRIWRIAYTNGETSPADRPTSLTSLSTAPLSVLLKALSNIQKPIRQHAADQIVDRIGIAAVDKVTEALTESLSAENQRNAPQLLWILHRLDSLSPEVLHQVFERGKQRTRIHAMRVCSEFSDRKAIPSLLKQGLRDSSGLVRRAAADAASQTADIAVVKEVINAIVVCPNKDLHLRHALQIALKQQLSNTVVANWIASSKPPKAASLAISKVISAIDGPVAGAISAQLLASGHLEADQSDAVLQHAASHLSIASANDLFEYARNLPDDLAALKMKTCLAMLDAYRSRKLPPPDGFFDWSAELASGILANINFKKTSWGQYSLDGREPVAWDFEPRRPQLLSEESIPFFSSLPGGEKGVGILRSRAFVLPIQLEFQLCGHLGSPKNSPSPENRIVLRDFETGQEIQSALPPRNDVATTCTWKAGRFAGRRAYIEVVDGLSAGAYAWIAFAQFTPQVVSAPQSNSQSASGVEQAVQLLQHQQQAGIKLDADQTRTLSALVRSPQIDGTIRSIAAETMFIHNEKEPLIALADLLQIGSTPRLVDAAISAYCTSVDNYPEAEPPAESGADIRATTESSPELKLLQTVFSLLDLNLRTRLAGRLADTRGGAEFLLSSMETGMPTASVLRDARIASQLSAFGSDLAQRVTQLTAALPPEGKATEELAGRIVDDLRLGKGDAATGGLVFQKHCLNCHKRGGEGGAAGPQLDGVATRGSVRLLEDILHPNRNVDIAFRTSTLVLSSGKVMTGIVRPSTKSGETLVMTTEGKLLTLATEMIDDRKDSTLSLMPGNVSKQLTEPQILDLMKYLLR